MRRWISVLVVCACTEHAVKHDPPPTPDQIRADVLAAVAPYRGHPEYAITDPDLVDPCITDAIARETERAEIVRRAAVCIANQIAEPDGLVRLERKIAERYAHPEITRARDEVTIDAGVVAGKLIHYRANIEILSSPNLDRGQWTTAEVVRFLGLGIAAHPDGRVYVARVEIPTRSGYPVWSYTYDRDADVIRVENIGARRVYVTETLGGRPDRARSLHTSELR